VHALGRDQRERDQEGDDGYGHRGVPAFERRYGRM
jgi:hypothetical protein